MVSPFQSIAALVLGFLVLFSATPNAFSNNILGAAPLRIIGLVSYSIYPPVIFFVREVLLPQHLAGIQVFQFMLVTCVTLTLLISYFSYRYIELPFLKMRER